MISGSFKRRTHSTWTPSAIVIAESYGSNDGAENVALPGRSSEKATVACQTELGDKFFAHLISVIKGMSNW